jgi:hypothetical protein
MTAYEAFSDSPRNIVGVGDTPVQALRELADYLETRTPKGYVVAGLIYSDALGEHWVTANLVHVE